MHGYMPFQGTLFRSRYQAPESVRIQSLLSYTELLMNPYDNSVDSSETHNEIMPLPIQGTQLIFLAMIQDALFRIPRWYTPAILRP